MINHDGQIRRVGETSGMITFYRRHPPLRIQLRSSTLRDITYRAAAPPQRTLLFPLHAYSEHDSPPRGVSSNRI